MSADSTYYGTAKPNLTQFSLHYRFRFRFSAGCSTLLSTRNSSLSTLRSLSSVPHPYPPFFAFSPYVFTPHRRGSAPFWGHLCGCTSPFILHSPLSILHSPLSTLHSPLSILHSPLSTLHSPFSILHSPFFAISLSVPALRRGSSAAFPLSGASLQYNMTGYILVLIACQQACGQ